MVVCRIGEPHVARAVELHAVQLQLHVVVAIAGHVVHRARSFVQGLDAGDFEVVVRERGQQFPAQVVQVVVPEPVALRFPDEAAAVGQVAHERAVLHPARGPRLVDDRAAGARRRIAGREIHDVLPPVRAIERQFLPVGRPADVVHVVAHGVVRERLAVADVEVRGLPAGQVVHVEIDHRIRHARLGIRFRVHRVVQRGLRHLQVVVGHLALVESVVRDLLSIGRPPERGALRQLFAVHPTGRAVLDPLGGAAVGGHRHDVGAGRVAHPEVVVLVERDVRAVGRHLLGELAAALRRSAGATPTPAPPAESPAEAARGRIAHHRGGSLGDIVAISFAAAREGEARAVVGPRHRQRARHHRRGELGRHPRELVVAGKRGQPVLGARAPGDDRQGGGGERGDGRRAGGRHPVRHRVELLGERGAEGTPSYAGHRAA